MSELTDAHVDELYERGYVIIEDFFDSETCRKGVEEMEKILPPWREVKDDPPEDLCMFTTWPTPSLWMNRFAITNDRFVNFAKKILRSDKIHLRVGTPFVRYPGCVNFTEVTSGEKAIHIDNGNNSLLPPSEDLRYSQIQFWCHLEDVGLDQAPLLLWPNSETNRTPENAEKLAVPAGSILLKTQYTWHSASPFTGTEGQRYIWGGQFGRADHYWEGFKHFTDKGRDPHFRELVSSLTPQQREMLRFPEVGHPYYTEHTLAQLEEYYPGWDATGEYKAAL